MMMKHSSCFLLLFVSLAIFFVALVSCNGDGFKVKKIIRDGSGTDHLKIGFYKKTCPEVEKIVRRVTLKRIEANPGLAAKLLRLQFHDCFVGGCDGSVLLDSTPSSQSEKENVPNLTLGGFDVIDDIKSALEEACPETVSCADIVVMAARDAVSFQAAEKPKLRVPMWDVVTGRKDRKLPLSSAEVVANLPPPNQSNFSALLDVFKSKNLDVKDLVVLTGAHTIGVAHCQTFSFRLSNFTADGGPDPLLDPSYVEVLKKVCPSDFDQTTTVNMDPQSSTSFDSNFFTTLTKKMGLFQSDAALLTDNLAANIVEQMKRPRQFLPQFAISMNRMGAIGVLTGDQGEIRKQCRAAN